MTNKERVERLQKAARLVNSVIESLDGMKTECGVCGFYRFRRPIQHQTAQKLGGAMGRMRDVADIINRMGGEFNDPLHVRDIPEPNILRDVL